MEGAQIPKGAPCPAGIAGVAGLGLLQCDPSTGRALSPPLGTDLSKVSRTDRSQ